MKLVVLLAWIISPSISMSATQAIRAEFEVVSIKPNRSGADSGRTRTLPDGSLMMINQPLASIIDDVTPVPVVEVVGLPGWGNTDRYDIVAKAPAGSTPAQYPEMVRQMFADRMKLVGHVAEQQRTAFALVMARVDVGLGPQLKRSVLECSGPRSRGTRSDSPAARPSPENRCGVWRRGGTIVSGGTTMDQFVATLQDLAGGIVDNRTGLQGLYSLTLNFVPPSMTADPTATPGDAPQFVTALQEQLGLKLVPEKTIVKIFVIDHIERPTPNQ